MRLTETIECKTNLKLIMRERGKIVDRREVHNIWVNLGRCYLPNRIAYSSLPASGVVPGVVEQDARAVRYFGFGIGGLRQLQLSVANAVPFSTQYPGTNIQTDVDPTVVALERPVRISSPIPAAPVLPPYDAGDVWLGQVQAPAVQNTPTSVTFQRIVSESEISYGPFLSVPLSEIGLFLHSTSASYIHVFNNTLIAYDTFDTISKTNAFALEIMWTIRF
jgi:hypothetical protein